MLRESKVLIKGIIKPYTAIRMATNFWTLKLSPFRIGMYLLELLTDKQFWNHIDKVIEKAKRSFPDPKLGGWMLGFPCFMLYPIIRLVRPEIVVETGVGPGGSSALILNALNKNRKGHLYSIDLPGYDAIIYPKMGRLYNIHVPPGNEVGWLVSPSLRERWSLLLGDSKEILPRLLTDLDGIDVFLHDSLHTDEHIMFELECVFPRLKREGLLLCDDVNEYWSLAFIEFCKKNQLPYFVLSERLGIAKKYGK